MILISDDDRQAVKATSARSFSVASQVGDGVCLLCLCVWQGLWEVEKCAATDPLCRLDVGGLGRTLGWEV